jgi:hypothetical protein
MPASSTVLNLLRRSIRRMRFLVSGAEFKPHGQLPGVCVVTERMQRKPPWGSPLEQPAWRSSDDAAHMRPEDPVLGIYRHGKAWALPWWIMMKPHIANLLLDGEPILITLCPVCSSGSAFNSVYNGRRLRFEVAGLYEGTQLIKDVETGSLWNHITGEALHGALEGGALERIALAQCEWQEWREMHPGSLVLWGDERLREGFASQHSPGSPAIGLNMLESLSSPIDARLPHNALVLGVQSNGATAAFPLDELEKVSPVLHGSVGGKDIVVFHRAGSLHALAYSAALDGERLQFTVSESGRIIDEQTGSHWNFAGECEDGPRQGSNLRYINSGIAEWYVWAAHHPSTTIFFAESRRGEHSVTRGSMVNSC